MVITESLANGLKNRFFLEIDEEVKKRLASFYPLTRGIKDSRNGWSKLVQKTREVFGRCALAFYEGGTKRKPYFAFCGLLTDKDRQYNSWNEKCLYVQPIITNHDPRFARPSLSLFNIGEHAISRIYQRGSVSISYESEVDIFSILPEFDLLPVWGAYWARILAELHEENPNLNICPVLPGKSGLFFAEFKGEKLAIVEIRTFVDDSHLTDLQQEVKQIFVGASDGIQTSPMAFYPANEAYGLDGVAIQLKVMSFRLVKEARKVGKVFFHHTKDQQDQEKFIDLFENCLKYYAEDITDDLSVLYKNENIRLLHNKLMELDRKDPE